MNLARRLPLLFVLLALVVVLFFLHDGGYLPTGGLFGRAGDGGDASGPGGVGVGIGGGDPAAEAARLQGAPGARFAEDAASGRAPGPGAGRAAAGGREIGALVPVRFGGVVKGTDGTVVSGGQVVVLGASGRTEAETDEAGRFAMELAPGRYKLLFQAEGLGALALRDYLIDGDAGSNLEFLLKETLRFEASVLRDGVGVAGAEVVLNAKLGIGSEKALTDGAGTAVIEGVPQGSYALRVDLPEGATVRKSLDLTQDRTLVLKVPPGVRVHGRVVDAETAATVAGARVTFRVSVGSGTFAVVEAVSDPDGRYEVDVPRRRVGAVTAAASGYAAWPSRAERRDVARRLAGVEKGAETELEIELSSGVGVAGRVTDASGEPVAGLDFRLVQRKAVFDVRTDDDGAYEVSGLTPGRYDVVVLSAGWFPSRTLRLNLPVLEAGETYPYDVEVQETLEVSGRVVGDLRRPAVGARVFLTGGGRLLRAAHAAGRDLETFTDARGWWRITDLPANQNVKVRASLGVLEATPRPIRTSALPAKPLELRLRKTVILEGDVFDLARRVPVVWATVTLKPVGPPGGRTARTLRTDAAGRFEAYELIPGRWTLLAKHVSYLSAQPREEVLRVDDEVVEIRLGLDPGLSVSGVVTDAGGRTLGGAKVTLQGTSREGARVRRRGSTRADGRFGWTGIERGTYRLTARRPGYRTGRIPGLLGGEQALQMVLRPVAKKP